MVRYKVVPEPRSVAFLFAVRDALPLVPGSVEDCCTRIRDRTDVPSRDEARELLTFCQALGLASETDRGFHRVRGEPETSELADRLVDNVFPTRELLAALQANGPLTPADAFDTLRERIPQWEQRRSPDWDDEWQDRIEHLLEWCAVLGLAERADGAYRRASTSKDS